MGRRLLKLSIALALVGLVWLVILPHAASTPKLAAQLQWLDQQGVDPSAMYYTELEMMAPILDRLALEQRNP
jgi:hypothetical protein